MTWHTRPEPINLKSHLPNGVLVSTVRLPSKHEDGWYVTRAFVASGLPGFSQRYETKAEAEAGHAEIVEQWTAKQGALPE